MFDLFTRSLQLHQVLLHVQLLHLLLKEMMIALGRFLGECAMVTLLRFELVLPIDVLLLRFLYAFLSLLLFGFVKGAFLKFL